jgi:hypothetical protein
MTLWGGLLLMMLLKRTGKAVKAQFFRLILGQSVRDLEITSCFPLEFFDSCE